MNLREGCNPMMCGGVRISQRMSQRSAPVLLSRMTFSRQVMKTEDEIRR